MGVEARGLDKMPMRKAVIKKRIVSVGVFVILACFAFFFLFPLIVFILNSVKTRLDIFSIPPIWIFKPMLENYRKLIFERPIYLRHIYNSLVVCGIAVPLAMTVGALAAYGLSRFNFKGKKNLVFWILASRAAPPAAMALPFFIMFRKYFHLYDTTLGLAIAYLTFNLPIVILVLKSFFDEIPLALEDAARIDGCSRLRTLFSIIMPNCLGGLFAIVVVITIFSWNEFFFALILTGKYARTIPVSAQSLSTPDSGTEWGLLFSISTVAIAPMIVLAICARKYLSRGLSLGGIKE